MKKIREMLDLLVHEYGLTAIKGGTEVEDMTYDELRFMKELAGSMIPMIVKIGGPEARNDIREMKKIGAEGILAPMIESEYALKNFIDCLHDIYGSKLPYTAINIETITAYNNLDRIMTSQAFKALDQITVGRTDLSGSLNKNPDDDDVLRITGDIVRRAREAGLKSSVGGAIDPKNALRVSDTLSPDLINTRHMVFAVQEGKDLSEAVRYGLWSEMELYRNFMEIEPTKAGAYRRRMDTTMSRIIKTERAAACS